jgi:AbrB family looped-hinge helix DNA binding protein
MTYTTVSTKYQIVIPKEVRRRVKIKPGQKFIIWEKGGVIFLVPTVKLEDMEGIFPELNTDNIRDEGERF